MDELEYAYSEQAKQGLNMNVPCAFTVFRRGKMKKARPAVDCREFCDYCGFNPQEQERRMRGGRFREVGHRFNAETGKLVMLKPGTRQLVFSYGGMQKPKGGE